MVSNVDGWKLYEKGCEMHEFLTEFEINTPWRIIKRERQREINALNNELVLHVTMHTIQCLLI